MTRTPLGSVLPDFPWNSLAEAKAKAASHPEGIVDLSVGTPVDEVSPSVQLAWSSAASLSGYPQTMAAPEFGAAMSSASERRYESVGLGDKSVMPVVGTEAAIAWLPTLLGLRGETAVMPSVAYPSYAVAAKIAGAKIIRADDPAAFQ